MTEQSNHNLFALIADRMADPKRPFMEIEGSDTITYGQVLEQSARYANALADLGVTAGDRVVAQTPKSPQAVMLYLGCLRAGAVYLPLNTGYTPAEIEYFLNDAKPKVAVCASGARPVFAELMDKLPGGVVETLDGDGSGTMAQKADAAAPEAPIAQRQDDDLAGLLYTSGTTGRAKGAMLSHRNLASNAMALAEVWRFGPDDKLIHALPIFHTHGLFVAINVTLLAGGTLLFLPAFDAEAILRLLPGATCMMGVPTFYSRLLAQPGLNKAAVAHMRLFISGSAPLSPETHKEFQDRTGQAILERYGMTETGMITSNPYDGKRIPGTVGFPLPDVSVRICDRDTGAVLEGEAVGMIEVRGPNVFGGYWQMPEKTKAEFRDDGFFKTGDLGFVDKEGYLRIVGRDKDLIISGGFNVYPAEVEAALDAIAGVKESAVIGLPHRDFGEGVTAVVAADPAAALNEAAIRDQLGHDLARYKLPKRVMFVEALPRNAMGKIEKKALRDRYATIFEDE